MPNTTRFNKLPAGPSEKPAGVLSLAHRTRDLCQVIEERMLSGDLRLLQWRESKGYDRPPATTVTWADPWWLVKIGEMESHPGIKALIERFKAEGLDKK